MTQAPVEPGNPGRRPGGRTEVVLLPCPVCGVDIVADVSFDLALGDVTVDALAETPVSLQPTALRVQHTCGVITHSREVPAP